MTYQLRWGNGSHQILVDLVPLWRWELLGIQCMLILNHSIWQWLDHGVKTACIRHRIMIWAIRRLMYPESRMPSPVTQALFLTKLRARWVKVIRNLLDKAMIRRTRHRRRNQDSEVLILLAIKEVKTKLYPTPKKDTAKHPRINFSLSLYILASNLNGQPPIGNLMLNWRT